MNVIDNSYFERIEMVSYEEKSKSKLILKKGISFKNVYEIEVLERNLYSLGIINFCYHHDVVNGKRFLYQASLCREWMMEHYEEFKNELSVELVTTYAYSTLYYGILSGNREHMKKRAELFGKYAHLEQNEWPANKFLDIL